MSAFSAIRHVIVQYATFRGRASRSEYWWFNLAYSILVFAALSWDHILRTTLVGLLCLFLVIPSLAVTARRLHDTNRSGWWTLLWIVPFGPIAVLVFMCLPGDRGDNFYGAPPVGARVAKDPPGARPLPRPRINSMNRRTLARPRPQPASRAHTEPRVPTST